MKNHQLRGENKDISKGRINYAYSGNIERKSESEVAQSSPTLCDDCSLPGSSVHGIFQATVLEWVAISFSSRSS